MRILFLDWPCFSAVDVQFTLEQAGHEFVPFFMKIIFNVAAKHLIRRLKNLLAIHITTVVSLLIIFILSQIIAKI